MEVRTRLVEPCARDCRLEREAQLDVCAAQLATGEPIRRTQLMLHVIQVQLQLRQHEALFHLGRNTTQDWSNEEGRGTFFDPIEDQLEQQRRHRGTFRVVKPIPITQALGRARLRDQAAVTVTLDQVFDDRAGLGQHELAVRDHWRLAERVNRA